MNLAAFEAALAGAADAALTNVAPSGGFAAFLQKNPPVAALFSIAVITAHTYLSNLASPAPAAVGPASATVGIAPPPKAS